MKITETEMTSDVTRHSATAAADGTWSVTWLPGRNLTRNQAITAMTIAEVVAARADDLTDNQHKLWGHLDGWAAELFISGPHAFAEAMLPPEDHQVPRGEWPSAGTLPGSAARRTSPLIVIAGQLEEAYQTGLSQAPATAPETYPGMAGAQSAVVLDGAEHPAAVEWPRDPATDDETRAIIAAYTAAPAAGEDGAALELTEDERVGFINVMTADEIKSLLAYVAGYAPKVFDHAVEARSESFAGELLGRIEDRDQAEYMAEAEGYCTVCGENVSHFIGYDGPQHFRGPHKLVTGAERRELFDAGHAPVIGWREAGAR